MCTTADVCKEKAAVGVACLSDDGCISMSCPTGKLTAVVHVALVVNSINQHLGP